MATDLIYNTVILHNVRTREFVQTPTYDASNTDVVTQHFRITVEGVVHVQTAFDVNALPPWTAKVGDPTPPTLEWLYERIRAYLGQSRGTLQLIESDPENRGTYRNVFRCVPTSSSTGSDPDRDVSNGPKPQPLQINQIIGAGLYRIVFTVECEKMQCSAYDKGTVPAVLNNRWSLEETMDENFFTTRVYSGSVRLSAGAWWSATASGPELRGFAAHAAKSVVVPGLERGFRRQSVTFNAEADGLTGTYRIVDRQVHTAAPWPATSITGRYSEEIGDGTSWYSTCEVAIAGPPHVNKKALIRLAADILEQRLRTLELVNQATGMANGFIVAGGITDILGPDNAVTASARIRRTPSSQDWQEQITGVLSGNSQTGLGDPLSGLTQPGAPYTQDPTVSPVPATYGYDPHGTERRPVVLFMLHCFVQSPCSRIHGAAQFSATGDTGEPEPADEYNSLTAISESSATLRLTSPRDTYRTPPAATAPSGAAYTFARVESSYSKRPLLVQMPIAGLSDPTAVFVTLGNTQGQRHILYIAERVGYPPELPEPMDSYADGNIHGYLLDHKADFKAPHPTPDGRALVYEVEAHYLYGLNRFPAASDLVRTATLPFLNQVPANTAIRFDSLYSAQLAPGDMETSLVR